MFHEARREHTATKLSRAQEAPARETSGSPGGSSLWQDLIMRSAASSTIDHGAGSARPHHVQPKLTVGAADDPLEREADRVAARAAPGQDRHSATPAPDVSRVAGPGATPGTDTPLDGRIASASGGRPLPDTVRSDMESTFGADFSGVRLHDSRQDRTDAESLGARAFTHKNHIWLGRDGKAEDRGLLAHELTHVIQQGTDIRRTAPRGIGTRPEATVGGGTPDVQGAWYNIGIPFTDYEFDPSLGGIKTAAGLVKDVAVDTAHGIGAAAEEVWEAAKVMWRVAMVLKDGAVNALVMLIEDPGKALEYIKDFVAGLVAKAPDKLQDVLAEYLAPRLGGPAGTTTGAAPLVQRQEDPAASAAERIPETRWQAVKRHLGVRLGYLKENWWEVIKDAALEILVPGVALYRHFPTMIKELGKTYTEMADGNYSAGFDHLLATARAAMAIVSSLLAQVSIVAFIIGSIIGTPITGVAALATIGIIVIGADVTIQLLTLAQSMDNLDRPRSPEEHETDYGLIADSSIAIAILLALVALGAIASATVQALLRRFPGITAAFESARARVRTRLDRGAKVPESPKPHELRAVEAGIERVPVASKHPVRSRLTVEQQLAFDRWVAERIEEGFAAGKTSGDINAGIDAALAGKDPAAVARMLKRQLAWVQEQEALARRANVLREGNPLDPKTANGPVDRGGDVSTRWDTHEPSAKEIGEAQRLAKATGEHIELFGDTYAGIDGTIGKPPRPLQLKGYDVVGADPVAMAQKALQNAKGAPYTRVEVSIEASTLTRAEVRKAFAKVDPRTITDGRSVSRVRVWCKDGPYEPTSFRPVPIPPHLDDLGGESRESTAADAGQP